MHKKKVDILLVTIASPLLIGIYEEDKLIRTIKSDKKSSEALPEIFRTLLKEYTIASMTYANGPGSFMAIKVAYIFLRSLSILNDIPLYAVDAFYFNQNRPIKAIGKLHFVKIQDKIETQKLNTVITPNFALPKQLKKSDFSKENAPMYGIAAV